MRAARLTLAAVRTFAAALVGGLVVCGSPAAAQAPSSKPRRKPPTPQQQATPPQATWEGMPRMQLERQFAGPLRDTLIQRWRDPGDGTICYVYLPITAPHSPPTQSGYVQYGANKIGSISCLAAPPATPNAQVRPAPRTAPAPR